MKTSRMSLLLGVCVLLLSALPVCAVSLTVSPNLQQFFTAASVSLTCEGQLGSDGWTGKRDTGSGTQSCGAGGRGFGKFNGPSCLLDEFKPVSGVYWCEGEAGEKSEEVNITVSDKHVILEIPALPVRTGSDVTLRCKKKTAGTAAAYFFFNGRRTIKQNNITINVQQSDEGLYWCAEDELGSSPQSYLRVKGSVTPISVTTTERATTTTTTTTTTITTHISHSTPSPPSSSSSSSSIFPVMAAVVFLCLLDLVQVVVLLTGWRQTGRILPSLQRKVVYEGLTLKKTANKISIIQSHVVFFSLSTNTAGVSEESN